MRKAAHGRPLLLSAESNVDSSNERKGPASGDPSPSPSFSSLLLLAADPHAGTVNATGSHRRPSRHDSARTRATSPIDAVRADHSVRFHRHRNHETQPEQCVSDYSHFMCFL